MKNRRAESDLITVLLEELNRLSISNKNQFKNI